ncbi:MAG: hypothetical protein LUD50_02960 [Clostridia bacterium]|nr:hypothetical protein [Clostridia bacterium]
MIGRIVAWASAAVVFLGTFIEFSKIKINPWSSLFKWIGDKLMSGVKEELKEVKTEQEKISKEQERMSLQIASDACDAIKGEIFRFYNECQKGQRHSEAEFNYIIQQNRKYEQLIQATGGTNGVYDMEYKRIMDVYGKCQRDHDFL